MSQRLGVMHYALLIVILVSIAYAGTLRTPFIFDDLPNIVENSSIRTLSLLRGLVPPFGTGIAGRPFINLTLAVNYAISGGEPWSYHLFNLLIHVSAALCLFGVLRRSFLSDRLRESIRSAATPLAFACALLWALHPLQTQAVTYTIQRCESLMGLCFLLVFYCAIRGWQSATPRQWHLAALLAFVIGIGAKEVIAVAPFLLLAYDHTFLTSGPIKALRRSSLLYAGLSLGLLCLGLLVAAGGTVSSGTGKFTLSTLDYWATQPGVLLRYLRLAFWPDRLSIDYGWSVRELRNTWPSLFILIILMIASFWALIRRKPWGYAGVFFFTVLAPTSLVPLPDIAFEHRMYLPLVAVIVTGVTGGYLLLNSAVARWKEREPLRGLVVGKGAMYLLILSAASLLILTFARNADYESDISIWAAAVRVYPGNSRAQANLGNAYLQKGRIGSALEHLNEALHLEQENARHHAGNQAVEEYLRNRPVYAKVQDNLGWAWLQKGNVPLAIRHLQEALKAESSYAAALAHMGIASYLQGNQADARDYFRRALGLNPFDPDIHVNLGVTLRLQGQSLEALKEFRAALRLMPRKASAHYGIGMVLIEQGKESEARSHFQEALRLDPEYEPAREIMKKLGSDEKMDKAAS